MDYRRIERSNAARLPGRPATSAPASKRAKPEVCPDPDPVQFVTRQLGLQPDSNQQWLLSGHRQRVIVDCSRQWGKSTITAAKALHAALTAPDSLVLVASRTARQSGLFVRKVAGLHTPSRPPTPARSRQSHLRPAPNGFSIVGIPGASGENIHGFSAAALLVINEATRVTDELYYAVRPVLATGGGAFLVFTDRAGICTSRSRDMLVRGGRTHDVNSGVGGRRARVTERDVPILRPTWGALAQERAAARHRRLARLSQPFLDRARDPDRERRYLCAVSKPQHGHHQVVVFVAKHVQ